MSAISPAYTLPDAPNGVDTLPLASTYVAMGTPGLGAAIERERAKTLDEEAIAEQWFLRSFGLGSWMTYQPKRFSIAKIVA